MTGNRDLLRGRLFPPRTDGAVERPRLLAAVTRPLRRVTLLTAGPGMGKSWLAGALMRASERAAWVSFEPSDAQGFAAWSYVVEALAPSLGDGAAPARELLRQGFETAGIERVAAHLSNVFAGLPDTLLVLDDVHVLFGTDAWATLFAWVRSAPDALRVVLTSREVPTEYLGDLALHGELTHVDHEGFRLTAEEAHAVLSGLEGLSLSADRENRLIRDADGWVGALQLLASAERLTPGSTEDGGPAATGYLWQFLAREIVDRLEPVERDVLVVAAALPSCESAILQTCFPGVPIPSVLDSLERRIPFLGRLSVEDDARRIHPLLKVFLQERLASDVVRLQTVLQRAREAYAGEGQTAAALEIALLLGDDQSILRLARRVSSTVLGTHYLLRIPRSLACTDPELSLQRAFVHYARNEQEECRFLLDRFPVDAPEALRQTMAFLSSVLPQRGAASQPLFLPRFTASADVRAPRHAVADATRVIMLLRQSVELRGQRRPGPALRGFEEMKSIEGWDASALSAFFALTEEAQTREECGELGRCLSLYDEITRLLDANEDLAQLRAYVHLGRAGILMKRFLLDDAAECLERGRGSFDRRPEALDAGYVVNEAELCLCRGDYAEGLARIRPLCAVPRLHYGSAHYILDLDRLGGADEGTKRQYRDLCGAEGLDNLNSEELMLFVRFSPADPLSPARLDEALGRMRADRYVSGLVDTLLLKASLSVPDTSAAIDALREAVHYAAPEGFLMPFVVEDTLPTDLLREAAADGSRSWGPRDRAFLESAIRLREERAGATGGISAPGHDGALLTPRELEVLAHMAGGESNAQIADALFVSLPTVKTHVANILSKLGAARRTEAIEKARRRGLLTE